MAANMNPPNQFGSVKPARGGEGTTCAQCEAMLPDWMDHADGGDLTATDRAAFELHIATCAECSQMLADAQRGAALLEMLKSPRPEPSAALMDRILASTSGIAGPAKSRVAGVITIAGGAVAMQTVTPGNSLKHSILSVDAAQPAGAMPAGLVLPFRNPAAGRFNLRAITHTMIQPRLAMTAAMAFFSIALTLNLTGVRLNQLSISDLKPSNLRRTFYQADASVVRYYDNLRVVYELESRVQEMKRSSDGAETDGTATGTKAGPDTGASAGAMKEKSKQDQQRKSAPKAGSGTSKQYSPMRQNFRLASVESQPSRRDTSEPALLPGFVECSTAVRNQLKEQEWKGVLA